MPRLAKKAKRIALSGLLWVDDMVRPPEVKEGESGIPDGKTSLYSRVNPVMSKGSTAGRRQVHPHFCRKICYGGRAD
jgi:hypothetical protein